MSYTPKHAKPASLNTSTAANRRARSGYRGRHAAPAVRQGEGTVVHELRAA